METTIHNLVFDPRYSWGRYAVFWLFIMMDEVLSLIGLTAPLEADATYILSIALDIIIVVIINKVLLPSYFYQKRYWAFAAAALALLSLNMMIIFGLDFYNYDMNFEEDWQYISSDILSSFINTASIYGFAIAIKLGKNAYTKREEEESIEKERMRTELNYLKQQVNPHFLFNVLNTVYIQSLSDHEAVPNTVMQLSDLMRYQIYEASKKEKVLMIKELEFLRNYVDLEKLRRDQLDIKWDVDGYANGLKVEPFIFLPIIENAIKHSANAGDDKAWISVDWNFDQEQIALTVQNSIGHKQSSDAGGFGIENLKKRLELAYPDKYSLNLESKDGIFIAKLVINEVHNSR